LILKDSPAIPPSATAHELFRGFSFVSQTILEEEFSGNAGNSTARQNAIAARSTFSRHRNEGGIGYESIGEEESNTESFEVMVHFNLFPKRKKFLFNSRIIINKILKLFFSSFFLYLRRKSTFVMVKRRHRRFEFQVHFAQFTAQHWPSVVIINSKD
jgi:hypothetical protein